MDIFWQDIETKDVKKKSEWVDEGRDPGNEYNLLWVVQVNGKWTGYGSVQLKPGFIDQESFKPHICLDCGWCGFACIDKDEKGNSLAECGDCCGKDLERDDAISTKDM